MGLGLALADADGMHDFVTKLVRARGLCEVAVQWLAQRG